MPSPSLPEVERKAVEVAEHLIATSPGPRMLYQVEGRSSAGKTTLLGMVARRLDSAGLVPIVVDPPRRALDAGPAALLQVASTLHDRGIVNGEFEGVVLARDRAWKDKLEVFRRWLHDDEVCRRVVLLCDEPLAWATGDEADAHFSSRTWSVVNVILDEARARTVVAGKLREGRTPTSATRLEGTAPARGWLDDATSWDELGHSVGALRRALGSTLAKLTPLEVRLLVACAAVGSVEWVRGWFTESASRREIVRRLAEVLESDARWSPLRRAWAAIALVRQPFPEALLVTLRARKLPAVQRAILKHCLLFEQDRSLVLHEILRAHARQSAHWLGPEDTRRTHRDLAQAYAKQFVGVEGGPLRERLAAEMEAFHHATEAQDAELATSLGPFFVEQLDGLGRALSRDARDHAGAVRVFERALAWDPEDDYAHHYLAFNLDVQAIEPGLVELHYQRAIEIEPKHAWWHSRYIRFLVARGRVRDAHLAWDRALDALELPDPGARPSLYEDLHVKVARLLLHFGQTAFAREVLGGIPADLRTREPTVAALTQRLEALEEAERTGAFVPGYLLRPRWWERGPFLLPPEVEGAGKRVRWLAARLDEVDGERLHLRVAEGPGRGERNLRVSKLEVDFDTFTRWGYCEPFKRLVPGTFLEIGVYVAPRREPVMHVRVHPRQPWTDERLPRSDADPDRYARLSGEHLRA
ncbi:MAG: tetratricopeptide repeat protein [Myxococcota bacterium]